MIACNWKRWSKKNKKDKDNYPKKFPQVNIFFMLFFSQKDWGKFPRASSPLLFLLQNQSESSLGTILLSSSPYDGFSFLFCIICTIFVIIFILLKMRKRAWGVSESPGFLLGRHAWLQWHEIVYIIYFLFYVLCIYVKNSLRVQREKVLLCKNMSKTENAYGDYPW